MNVRRATAVYSVATTALAVMLTLTARVHAEVSLYEPEESFKYSTKYKANGSKYEQSYVRNAIPSQDEITYEKIEELIKSKNITRIEDLISQLPAYMRDANYVVAYRSRSIQLARPKEPRIIMYTPTARLILTYNSGNPRYLGHNTVEMIQFRDKTAHFEFRELTFDGKNLPTFSNANPPKCLACHQSPDRKNIDPRPNWEPYNSWPGMIGSNDGNLFSPLRIAPEQESRFTSEDLPFIQDQPLEGKRYVKDFISTVSKQNPRYSALLRLNPSATSDLTAHLNTLNVYRVARLMRENKELMRRVPEAPYVLTSCAVPIENENFQVLRNHFNNRYFDFSSTYGNRDALSRNITEFFEPLGVDTSDWSMDFGTRGKYAFIERFGSPDNDHERYGTILRELMPEVFKSCDDILPSFDKNLKTLIESDFGKKLLTASKNKPLKTGEEIFRRCTSCHESYEPGTPQLDLLNEKFFEDIRKRTHLLAPKEITMPPIQKLPYEEREALLKYIQVHKHK